jgi:hypothetical protein
MDNSVKTVEIKSVRAGKVLASQSSSKEDRAKFARNLVDESSSRVKVILRSIQVAAN